jgi:twitching motility protein PilT
MAECDAIHTHNEEFLRKICWLLAKDGTTDIHITEGRSIWVRWNGELKEIPSLQVPEEGVNLITQRLLKLPTFDKVSCSCTWNNRRIRVRQSRTVGRKQLFLRVLSDRAPEIHQLNYNTSQTNILRSIADDTTPGLYLVAGPTGSGKSTLMASVLQTMLDNLPIHICTIEDPIEYILYDNVGVASQREIPNDVIDFATGVRDVLREDPDVIMIGEIRDPDTALHGLIASETGHKVIGTIHAGSCHDSIERFIGLLGRKENSNFYGRIAQVLRYVLYLPSKYKNTGNMKRPLDILTVNDAIKANIREGHIHRIPTYSTSTL